VLLDSLVGDPRRHHPVAGFGRIAAGFERRMWAPARLPGVLFCGALAGGAAAAVSIAVDRLRPRFAWEACVLWAALGGHSLRREAARMQAMLAGHDLESARRLAPALMGRDPSELDAYELARATVESVAENTSDAVVASLLWFAVAGAHGVAAHRAINTLDAMVGYRGERYEQFGWAAARLDDLANWLPARLTALLAVSFAPDRRAAWTTLRRDGRSHPSPNAGQAEAAFAGALGIRLGGTNRYGTRVEQRPELGAGRPATVADIGRAIDLSRQVECAALGVCILLARVLR
jgi:adenosylcobinamide-phosphate synthase